MDFDYAAAAAKVCSDHLIDIPMEEESKEGVLLERCPTKPPRITRKQERKLKAKAHLMEELWYLWKEGRCTAKLIAQRCKLPYRKVLKILKQEVHDPVEAF